MHFRNEKDYKQIVDPSSHVGGIFNVGILLGSEWCPLFSVVPELVDIHCSGASEPGRLIKLREQFRLTWLLGTNSACSND